MEKVEHLVYLSLGSNLGDRSENLIQSIRLMHEKLGTVTAISSFYESASWGYTSENKYLNCCIELKSELSPADFLAISKEIEQSMGRKKTTEYTDRSIDIDILFYGNLKIDNSDLKIPHPHIEKRAFVLLPLAEIAPDLYHHKHFLTIAQLSLKYMHTEDIKCYKTVEKSAIIN